MKLEVELSVIETELLTAAALMLSLLWVTGRGRHWGVEVLITSSAVIPGIRPNDGVTSGGVTSGDSLMLTFTEDSVSTDDGSCIGDGLA